MCQDSNILGQILIRNVSDEEINYDLNYSCIHIDGSLN